jgi:hypothetical protein
LRPGDAIRLETGEHVVFIYMSVGFMSVGCGPTEQHIERRGPPRNSCANVPVDAQVILA